MLVDIQFSWLPTDGAAGYRLWMNGSQLATVPGSATSHTHRADIPLGRYEFSIEAFNESGFGPRRTVVRDLRRPAPGAVEGFDVSFLMLSTGSGTGTAPPPAAGTNDALIAAYLDNYTLPSNLSDLANPADPDTSGGTVEVTTIGEWQSAVALSNRLINVADGTYTGNLNVSGSNLRIVGSSAVTLNGSITMDSGNPAVAIGNNRFEGFNVDNGGASMTFRGVHDIMFYDMAIYGQPLFHRHATGPVMCRRIAMVDCTVESDFNSGIGDFTIFSISDSGGRHEDFIFLNCYVYSQNHTASRLGSIDNVVALECYYRGDGAGDPGDGTGFRFYAQCDDCYVGGRSARRGIFMGRMHMNDDPPGFTDAVFDNYNHWTLNSWFLNDSGNTGTVSNVTPYYTTAGQSYSYSPLTNGGGIDTTVLWDGLTPPDATGYGAGRSAM